MNEDAGVGKFPSDAEFRAALDVEAGWPPRFRATPVEQKHREASSNHLKVGPIGAAFGASIRQARVHAAVGVDGHADPRIFGEVHR